MREEDDRRRDMLLRSDMGMRGGHRGQMEYLLLKVSFYIM
jgi:hypothetical protein